MKLSLFLLASLSMAAASSKTIQKQKNIQKLVQKSRRLEDENQDEEEEGDEYDYLQNYKLHFLECKAGEKVKNQQGESEYNVAVYRLCPAEDCSSDVEGGCKSGYGDYVVGLNSFVDAYLEDERENEDEDQEEDENEFNLDEYIECKEVEYEAEQNDEGRKRKRRRAEEMPAYYVGPACTEDGTDIKLEFFSDYTCTTPEEDVAFEDLVGYELPYQDGGLAYAASCKSCYKANDDGEYEIARMCEELAENNAGGCEDQMADYGNYMDSSQCEYISELTAKPSSGGGATAFWIILVLLVVGAGAYWFFTNKKKQPAASSTVNSQGLMS